MKKFIYLLLFVFALMMSVSSCKKDESTPAKVLSTQEKNKEMIISVSWKISSHKEYGTSLVLQDCEKDDLYTFNADSTFSHNVGSLICNGETNSSGSWIIYPDGTVLLTYGSTTMGMVVTNGQLVVSQYDVRYDEMSYQLTLIPK